MQRRQVLKHNAMLDGLGLHAVYFVDLYQGKVALSVFGGTNLAFDGVAGMQVETPDLRVRDIDIVGAGQIRGIGRAQETKAIGQHFKHAVAENLFALLGPLFHDGKHEFLLAQRSEEHTSELQSLMRISYAVFCLKKKRQDTKTQN